MTATSVEKVNGTPVASEPRPDPVRAAEAEAIRARAAAERQALLLAAEGEKALKLQQAEQLRLENEKQALALERAAARTEKEKADLRAKTAEADRRAEDAERARRAAQEAEDEQKQAEAETAAAVEKSTTRWRRVALGFYALCAAVALPVQMAAFWDPKAKYLLVAPVFIEVIALVALVGAAAAVTDGRPQWHYRLVAWAGALTAATINVVHGLDAFDPATAFGTALASLAAPECGTCTSTAASETATASRRGASAARPRRRPSGPQRRGLRRRSGRPPIRRPPRTPRPRSWPR
ncbi:hypothetical protein LUX34_23945 [Streptomyces werraensis]|nr:hypothetical protein [Streptomyces werraensis]